MSIPNHFDANSSIRICIEGLRQYLTKEDIIRSFLAEVKVLLSHWLIIARKFNVLGGDLVDSGKLDYSDFKAVNASVFLEEYTGEPSLYVNGDFRKYLDNLAVVTGQMMSIISTDFFGRVFAEDPYVIEEVAYELGINADERFIRLSLLELALQHPQFSHYFVEVSALWLQRAGELPMAVVWQDGKEEAYLREDKRQTELLLGDVNDIF